VTEAKHLAATLLDVPEFRERRWRHVGAVAAKAEQLAPALGEDGPLLVASAWVHDIGYAAGLRKTGFHPLDGARALDRAGALAELAALVANHSAAAQEAELRGLSEAMAAYPDAGGGVRDALWACDMTTGPTGVPVSFDERLREITERYGADHTVPRAIAAGSDEIRAAILRTREMARAHGLNVEL